MLSNPETVSCKTVSPVNAHALISSSSDGDGLENRRGPVPSVDATDTDAATAFVSPLSVAPVDPGNARGFPLPILSPFPSKRRLESRVSAAEVATQSAADDPSPAPTGRDAVKAVMDRPRAAGLGSRR